MKKKVLSVLFPFQYFSSPVELSDCLSVTTHSTQPIPTPSHCSPYKPPAPVTAGQMVETPGGQDLSEEQGGTTESEMDTSQCKSCELYT